MNAVFRHLAVRLWGTAILGILASLALLPWWQRMVGVRWLPFVVGVVLVILFFSAGWGMDRLGRHFLAKTLQEAAVWERAGMIAEAGSTLERCVALFDSFWFSPGQRRTQSRLLTARLSRFYLSRPSLGPRGRFQVQSHLFRYPEDLDLASAWLTWLMTQEAPLPSEHETADRIGQVLAHNIKIQQRLLRFYLAHGRTDFNALQIYEKGWHGQLLQDPDQIQSVALLLLGEARLGDWMLALYLRAYQAGCSDCLAGIVAATRWLPPAPENRGLLQEAGRIADQLGEDQIVSLVRRFRPPSEPPAVEKSRSFHLSGFSAWIKKQMRHLGATARMLMRFVARLPRWIQDFSEHWHHSIALRRTVAAAGVIAGLVVLAIAGQRFIGATPEMDMAQVPPAVPELPALTTDPFTIQVAAYLKVEDAKRFVAKLKESGLDAFWNEATSAHRKWFQVKVSHFTTKAEAQAYAEQLKAKGLIEDFYVANYTPPE